VVEQTHDDLMHVCAGLADAAVNQHAVGCLGMIIAQDFRVDKALLETRPEERIRFECWKEQIS